MILLVLLCLAGSATAQKNVAILDIVDQSGKIPASQKLLLGGMVGDAVNATHGFSSFTPDISQIMDYQSFMRSGAVSDSQIKKVGEMTGCQYILVIKMTEDPSYYVYQSQIIDVETSQIIKQATDYSTKDIPSLSNAAEKLAKKLLSGISTSSFSSGSSISTTSGSDFTENTFGINMKMKYVQGGSFMMGCTSEQGDDCNSDEKTLRRVTVSDYYIGVFEVTQGQWEKVMGTSVTQQRNKKDPSLSLAGTGSDYPMYYVSWEEAMAFCRELSRQTGKTYTLPTEAQWEYAARGGSQPDGSKYSGSYSVDAVAWYDGNSNSSTHPVGTKRPNALGLYDMSGNVWEWCLDWYGDYRDYDTENPTGASSGSRRVLRGGSWRHNAQTCRVSYRNYNSPGNRFSSYGFRVVLVP